MPHLEDSNQVEDVVILDYMDRPLELFLAVLGNKPDELRKLLEKPEHKAKINHPVNTQGLHTMIFFACYGSASAEIVEILIENGADILVIDNLGRLPLDLAANSGKLSVLKVLLNEYEKTGKIDAFIDACSHVTGQSSFHALCYPASGANGEKKSDDADSVGCFKALLVRSKRIAKEILNAADHQGLTPIMLAKYYKANDLLVAFAQEIGQDAIDAVELPDNMAELVKGEFFGRAPLIGGSFELNKEMVEDALQKGEDPNIPNIQSSRTPLQLVCCKTQAVSGDFVKLLLPYTSSPMAASAYGKQTALHYAANNGQINAVRALCENRYVCNMINARDAKLRTALHAVAMGKSNTTVPEGALLSSREEVIELLFDKGIDFDAVDIDGNTAAMIAEKRGNKVVHAKILSCIEAAKALAIKPVVDDPKPYVPAYDTTQQEGDKLSSMVLPVSPTVDRSKKPAV